MILIIFNMKVTYFVLTLAYLLKEISCADFISKTETKGRVFEEQVDLEQYSFYFVYDTDDVVTYHDCMRLCEEKNMTLVSFETPEKYQLIDQFVTDNEDYDKWYWTSAYKGRKSDIWVWSSSDLEMTFFQWATGEPNRKPREESCINFMVSRGGWDDEDCEIKLSSYVCDVTRDQENPPGGGAAILVTNFVVVISLVLSGLL